MSEYEQWLLDGDVDVAIALLRRLAGQVTCTRSFPPPAGYARWNKDAVDELLGEVSSHLVRARHNGPRASENRRVATR